MGYNIKTWIGGVGLSLVFLQGCGPDRETTSEKPNFVWIISEDNSKHYLELFDPHGIATPNIQRLAEEGVLFTRAFSNAPVCSVARSTLISSCFSPRTGTQFHRRSKLVPMPDGILMFPVYLRNEGYYTTNNSKEDYNYLKSDGTWDESSGTAHWKNRQPNQPFFHKESHPVSHESRLHFNEALMETYVPVTDPDSVFVFPNHPDTELFRFTGAFYRDRILAVDSIVGNVIKELEEAGQLENTFIFYFGDNGGVLPGSKGYLYESGLHIPLVVRVPRNFRHLVDLKSGSESERFVSFADFGPTLLDLAGIDIPGGIDGKAFLGKRDAVDQAEDQGVAFGYADRFDEKYDMVRSVRKGTMKYMRNYQPFNFDGLQNNYRYLSPAYRQWRELYQRGALNEVQRHFFESRQAEELYDLEKDPFETTNLAGDPAHGAALQEMRDLLTEWVKGMPDLSFFPERDLWDQAFDNPVLFGQQHHAEIGELIDLADLSLRPFSEAIPGIHAALNSMDPMKIYWGLIVCSSFGTAAEPFYPKAREFCLHQDLLVRTRAAEFLGLTGAGDPVPVITGALMQSTNAVEALLILNSLVLLMDGPSACEFSLQDGDLFPEVLKNAEVQRRLEYIHGRMDHLKKL